MLGSGQAERPFLPAKFRPAATAFPDTLPPFRPAPAIPAITSRRAPGGPHWEAGAGGVLRPQAPRITEDSEAVGPFSARRRAQQGLGAREVTKPAQKRHHGGAHLPSGRFMPVSAAGRRRLCLRLQPLSRGAAAARSCSTVTDSLRFLMPEQKRRRPGAARTAELAAPRAAARRALCRAHGMPRPAGATANPRLGAGSRRRWWLPALRRDRGTIFTAGKRAGRHFVGGVSMRGRGVVAWVGCL